eukprot:6214583-Pleurochrysis_carterae.AAC.3
MPPCVFKQPDTHIAVMDYKYTTILLYGNASVEAFSGLPGNVQNRFQQLARLPSSNLIHLPASPCAVRDIKIY